MKCRATESKPKSQNKVIEFMATAMAWVLFECGFDKEKVNLILSKIQKVAVMMIEDYLSFLDIRKALKEEYDFEFEFKG